jgi:hypothetical protein
MKLSSIAHGLALGKRITKRGSWGKDVFLFCRRDSLEVMIHDVYGEIRPFQPNWYDLVDNDFVEHKPGVFWKEETKP